MKHAKGSVVIYVVLLMFIVMTSAAIVLSSILSKHIRASQDYISTERAFAAANSGIEEMLDMVADPLFINTGDVKVNRSIEYADGSSATIVGVGCGIVANGQKTPHLAASGEYRGAVRRILFGGGDSACPRP